MCLSICICLKLDLHDASKKGNLERPITPVAQLSRIGPWIYGIRLPD